VVVRTVAPFQWCLKSSFFAVLHVETLFTELYVESFFAQLYIEFHLCSALCLPNQVFNENPWLLDWLMAGG